MPPSLSVHIKNAIKLLKSRQSRYAAAGLLAFGMLAPSVQSQSSNFTIVALPDTQYYSESFPQTFTAQTQWIVNNASALNVQMVLGLGDIVQTATNVTEWQNADASIKLLDNAHIPYLLAVGNRDYSDGGSSSGRTSELTNFNTYFGPSRYQNYSWYKGQYPSGSNENFYGVLTINGKTYLFLMLEFYPRDSSLAWANSVLAAYPTAEAIVVTHANVFKDGTLVSECDAGNAQQYDVGADNNGDGLWNKFISQHSNISLVLNGHFTFGDSTGEAVSRRTDLGVNGNIVNQMLSDYQEMTNGGNGYLRILTFNPSANTISVQSYSPTLNSFLTDTANQFTVPWHSTGQNPTGTGTVSGIVKDIATCNAISGATASTTGASQSSDSTGTFNLSVATPQQYSVTVQSNGYFPTTDTVNAWTGFPELSKYFLSTQQPGTIAGKVTDQFGNAILGATVWYSGGTSTTDAGGNYTFSNVPVGTYTVTGSANGYQTASTQNVTISASTTSNVSFTLSQVSGSIAGTVTNASGAAIVGATVSYNGGSAITDSNGHYTLSNIALGTYNVTASATGFQSSTQSNVNVAADTTTTVNFSLSAGASQTYSISGAISPASIGSGTSLALSGPAPLLVRSAAGAAASGSSSAKVAFGAAAGAGNTIVVFTRFGRTTITGVTDNQAGGSNSYTSVLGPTQWGVAPNSTDRWAQVFVAKNIRGATKLTITVNFAAGSSHDVYLAAMEYSGVDPVNPVNATAVGTGKVSQNGAPMTPNLTTTIANTKLVATSEDSNESYTATGNGTGFTTDAAASIASISGGKGWASLSEDMTAVAPGSWKATASSAPGVDDWAILLVALAPAPSQTVTADANGNYTFNNVNNGTYTVTPSKTDTTFTPANQSPTVNGASVTGINFAAQGFTGTISGTVANSGGTPIAGATVSYGGGSITSASDGTYSLSNVPVGNVSLTATATGYQSSTQSVTVTANTTTTQNFTLTATVGTIAGRVTNSSGTAIVGAAVSYSGGSTITDSNGSYTLSNVPTGSVSVTAGTTGYQSSTQSVTVTANTTTTQNFTLVVTVGTISGTVMNSSGAAVAGATVSYSGGSTTTGINGSYSLSNVPTGSISLTATATGYQSSTQSVTVAANTTTTQNFTLSATVGSISGSVTDLTGAAIAGATISYSGGSTTSASNGTYTLSSVPTGTVSVTATATGYQSSTQSVTVTANTTTTQNFMLSSVAAVGTISGTVADSGGAAISGATVGYSGGATTSGAGGTYTLSNVPAGTVSVTASATGFQSSTQSITVAANTTTTQNFTLSAIVTVGTISGTVTDSTGTAILGATVSYSGGSTATASDGSYTLSNVPVGTVSVTASATGFQSSTQSVTVAANTTTTQSFTLTASAGQGFSISGTVSPASVGSGTSLALSGPAPVLVQSAHGSKGSGNSSASVSFGAVSGAGDTIVLFVRLGGTTVSTVTDNQTGGSDTYTSVLGPTQWGSTNNRLAQVYVAKNVAGGSKLTITVSFGGNSTFAIYLTALEYSGVDPVNPVNAAAVGTGTVSKNGAPATGNLTTTVPNAKLVATSWDSNESYTATGNGAGYTTDTAAGSPSITGGSGWPNLTEDRTAAAPGVWNATASSSPHVSDWAIQLIALAPASAQTVSADASGNYTFNNLSNGTYTVTPRKSGSTFTPASQSPTVNGANVTGVNFSTQGSTGTISGAVTDSSGTAISGASVFYSGGSTSTSTNGSYTLSNVPAGTVSVSASATGFQSSTQSVTVTANTTTTQNFTLSSVVTTGTISGTVTNSTGTAISGATVSYSGGSTSTAANGSYTLSNVPAGTVSVTASATGFQSSTQSVTVTTNSTTTQNFTLSTAVTTGTIAGTVTDTTGTAISGATVSYSGGSTNTAANGGYTLSNVPAGTISVTASATNFQSSTQSATVTANTTTTQNFMLSASAGQGISVSGTISPASIGSGTSVALSGPAPVLVQSVPGAAASGSSSVAVTFPVASGAGNTIVVFARFGGTTISSVTDNQAGGSNIYTSVLGPTQWGVAPSSTDRWGQVFVTKNIRGGTKLSITVRLAASSSRTVYVAAVEYSGVDPVNPVNATAVGTGKVSQNGAPTTPNLTTTVANAKLVATSEDSNESYTATGNGTGFTTDAAASIASISGGKGWPSLTEDMTAVAPGSWKATTGSSGVGDWVIMLVALTPAPSQTVTADVNGNYTLSNVNNGTFTVTPSKSGRTFTPANRSVTVNGSNLTGVNFTGQ